MGEQRKVSRGLGIGIFLIPLVFSWFTLRKGHSSLARIVSLAWLVVTMGFLAGSGGLENRSTYESVNQIISDMAVEDSKQQPIVLDFITRIKAGTARNKNGKEKLFDLPTEREKTIYSAVKKMLFEKSDMTEERVFIMIGQKFDITKTEVEEIYKKVLTFENQ